MIALIYLLFKLIAFLEIEKLTNEEFENNIKISINDSIKTFLIKISSDSLLVDTANVKDENQMGKLENPKTFNEYRIKNIKLKMLHL